MIHVIAWNLKKLINCIRYNFKRTQELAERFLFIILHFDWNENDMTTNFGNCILFIDKTALNSWINQL